MLPEKLNSIIYYGIYDCMQIVVFCCDFSVFYTHGDKKVLS